jgi:hypothetical protein
MHQKKFEKNKNKKHIGSQCIANFVYQRKSKKKMKFEIRKKKAIGWQCNKFRYQKKTKKVKEIRKKKKKLACIIINFATKRKPKKKKKRKLWFAV